MSLVALVRPPGSRSATVGDVVADRDGAPFDRALRLGHRAGSAGLAFAAGYLAAVETLTGTPGCLAVTEAGGGHPAAMESRFQDGRVTGTKRFATLASAVDTLHVLADTGEVAGRKALVLVRVARTDTVVEDLPPTAFCPEVRHAVVRLDGAPGVPLPGDGWADHVRRFRPIEDRFVTAALTAWALPYAPPPVAERLLVVLAALTAPDDELVVAATLPLAAAALDEVPELPDWPRDRALLRLAAGVRAQRQAARWAALRP